MTGGPGGPIPGTKGRKPSDSTTRNARRNAAAYRAMTDAEKQCGKTIAEIDAEQAVMRAAARHRFLGEAA